MTTLAAGAYRRALYEVLQAIAAEHGVTLAAIDEAARRKRAERGGFGMRLWLDGVDPSPAG